MTPVEINTTDYYGYFQGSGGRYETFLDYCPCGDFRRNKLPYKHIYRLAIELGLMDIEVEQNKYSIPTPRNERVDLDEVIDRIEALSLNAQRKLLNISGGISSKHPIYETYSNEKSITELLDSGIIIEPDPQMRTMLVGTKYDLMDLLDHENILYKKSMKKDELAELCKQHIPEKTKQEFGEAIYITVPTKFSFTKIHHYLHRKFFVLSCCRYNEDTGEFTLREAPYFSAEILPDDNVTEQLIKHGYYSRK